MVWVVATLAPDAGAAVLHDQYDNFGAPQGVISDNPPAAGDASQAADDFVVPPGPAWSIEQVDVRDNGAGAPTSMNVFIYADAATLPGTLVAARTGAASMTVVPDRSVMVSPPVQLQPGTYWVGVQANVPSQGWGWVERTAQAGSGAAWKAEYLAPSCQVFARKPDCLGPTDPDQVFRVSGTALATPSPPQAPQLPQPPVILCAGEIVTISGFTGPDALAGTPRGDVIAGLGGNDRIRGLAGDDVICGGTGKDTLIGGPGKDRLLGEVGKDVLKGGNGKDILKGGPGKDVQTQ